MCGCTFTTYYLFFTVVNNLQTSVARLGYSSSPGTFLILFCFLFNKFLIKISYLCLFQLFLFMVECQSCYYGRPDLISHPQDEKIWYKTVYCIPMVGIIINTVYYISRGSIFAKFNMKVTHPVSILS